MFTDENLCYTETPLQRARGVCEYFSLELELRLNLVYHTSATQPGEETKAFVISQIGKSSAHYSSVLGRACTR